MVLHCHVSVEYSSGTHQSLWNSNCFTRTNIFLAQFVFKVFEVNFFV